MNSSVVLIGLPATGKTTFLAALWYYISFNSDAQSLQLDSLNGDDNYLNSIRDEWARCEHVPRTLLGQEDAKLVQMNLKNPVTQNQMRLSIPDFSGETFKAFIEERRWNEEMEKLFNNASGFLLFLHIGNYRLPVSIHDSIDVEEVLRKQEKHKTNSQEIIEEWNHSMIPTQVQIVDLLQFLVYHTQIQFPVKIGVMLSAWDKAGKNKTPDKWLEDCMPLLHQYLKANAEIFDTNVFGVSAQGGDYVEKKANKDTLLAFDEPAKRIKVQLGKDISNDISLPLRWLTE